MDFKVSASTGLNIDFVEDLLLGGGGGGGVIDRFDTGLIE